MDFYNFNDLKKVYGNATAVNNNRVVFNIKGNYFRLVFLINFIKKCVILFSLKLKMNRTK